MRRPIADPGLTVATVGATSLLQWCAVNTGLCAEAHCLGLAHPIFGQSDGPIFGFASLSKN